MKYIAFYKGNLVPDTTLDWVLDQASRGKATPEARKLILYPDKRYGRPGDKGIYSIKSMQKHEGRLLEDVFQRQLQKKSRLAKSGF